MMTKIIIHRPLRRPRGVVLITAMWICIALAAVDSQLLYRVR